MTSLRYRRRRLQQAAAITLPIVFALVMTTRPVRSAATVAAATDLAVVDLRTEFKANPAGIDVTAPRFSWRLESSRRGVMQTA